MSTVEEPPAIGYGRTKRKEDPRFVRGQGRYIDDLKLPGEGKSAAHLKPAELKMAAQLIQDMTSPWKADAHVDGFATAMHALVNQKVAAGQTETVTPLEASPAEGSASNVLDLTELLAKSLAKRQPAPAGKPSAAKSAALKVAAKRSPRKHA